MIPVNWLDKYILNEASIKKTNRIPISMQITMFNNPTLDFSLNIRFVIDNKVKEAIRIILKMA